MKILSRLSRLAAFILTCALFQSASAQTFCVWDPLGAGGDYYSLFKDYQVEAKRWNVNLDLEVYVDDNQLISKFEGGHCDMVSMLGLRALKFNKFTGTIDSAPGSLDSYAEMRNLLGVLAQPKIGKYMVEGSYEVVGILPLGAGYGVVADRSIVSLQTASGKRVLVPAFAENFDELIGQLKLIKVRAEMLEYGKAFRQGKADIIIAPMVVYKALEIDKTLAERNGGILRRPLFEFTMQILDRPEKFPSGFGQLSREYVHRQTDHSLLLARNLDNQVDSRYWIYVKHGDFDAWDEVNRKVAKEMTRNGILDRKMLGLMLRIRCVSNPDEPECRDFNLESKPQAVGEGH